MANLDALGSPSITADFGFTEEHALARAQARRFLSDRCPITEVRRLHDASVGFSADLHREVAKMGWLGLVSPEALGGLGLDHLHLALLMDEMGRVLLPSPFLGTLLGLRAINVAGSDAQQKELCPSVIAGDRVLTIALSEPNGSWELDGVETRAEPIGGGYRLDGIKTHVLFGEQAELVIVPARIPDGSIALFTVSLPTAGAVMDSEVSIDSTRRLARLRLEGARVGPGARLEGDGSSALREAHQLGWMALSAEMAGGIETTLELTRRYASERIQFGRAIGAFQAVKHPIVDVMVGCEWVRSLAFGAAAAFDQDPARGASFARMAKALASDHFDVSVRKGVQLHGGFGFTWDCDVHFYFKRSLWSRSTLGDATHHRRHLGEALFGAVEPAPH